jgi:hypothetical protein
VAGDNWWNKKYIIDIKCIAPQTSNQHSYQKKQAINTTKGTFNFHKKETLQKGHRSLTKEIIFRGYWMLL